MEIKIFETLNGKTDTKVKFDEQISENGGENIPISECVNTILYEDLKNQDSESYTIDEFLKYVKENRMKFISYLEIIIDDECMIHLAIPSHQMKLIELACKKENCTKEELERMMPEYCHANNWIISKYGFVSVWYNMYTYSARHYNRKQMEVMRVLRINGLISQDSKGEVTDEYETCNLIENYYDE